MRLLLDTHVVLWWRADPARIPVATREAIATADEVHVSAASAWEVAIKVALGRLELPEAFEAGVLASGFTPLPVTFAHAADAGALPPHHGDPFDRMLIAQARLEGLALVTRDPCMQPYDVTKLWS